MWIHSKQPIGPRADIQERILDTATGLVYDRYRDGKVYIFQISGDKGGATYAEDAAVALWALLLEQATPATRQPNSYISEDQPSRPSLQQLIIQAEHLT